MSNLSQEREMRCDFADGCGAVSQIIRPKDTDLGGFAVRRALPNRQLRRVGPWVFFDHMGPARFPAGQGIDVRPHPHINIATVTYLFEGEILHRDSLGSYQAITPGDLNLMVAGSGIVHSERESPQTRAQPHALHGLQLWLALPEEAEETAPAFYHYAADSLPQTSVDGVPVRVMMGQAYGLSSPVKTFGPTLYIEARLQAGQSLVLPDAEERALYVVSGSVRLKDTLLAQWNMAVLAFNPDVCVVAEEDCQIALIGGGAVGHRYLDWNFVSSRIERVKQAKRDWISGRFELVPGDEREFIPYPTEE